MKRAGEQIVAAIMAAVVAALMVIGIRACVGPCTPQPEPPCVERINP